jgi:putative membrane protein
MRYLVWALRLIVFVAVLMFALKNTEPVAVNFYGDLTLQGIPLIVVMLSAFVLGTLFGLLLTVPASLRRRREIVRLRKELDRIQAAVHPHPDNHLSPDAVMPLSPF